PVSGACKRTVVLCAATLFAIVIGGVVANRAGLLTATSFVPSGAPSAAPAPSVPVAVASPTPHASPTPLPIDPELARFPLECRGFVHGKRTRLAAVCGRYEGKHAGAVWSVALVDGGRRVASGGRDGFLRTWSLAGEPLGDAETLAAEDTIAGLAGSPDGRLVLACGGDGAVWLWESDGHARRRIDLAH